MYVVTYILNKKKIYIYMYILHVDWKRHSCKLREWLQYTKYSKEISTQSRELQRVSCEVWIDRGNCDTSATSRHFQWLTKQMAKVMLKSIDFKIFAHNRFMANHFVVNRSFNWRLLPVENYDDNDYYGFT